VPLKITYWTIFKFMLHRLKEEKTIFSCTLSK
jgi:hypothetical protein